MKLLIWSASSLFLGLFTYAGMQIGTRLEEPEVGLCVGAFAFLALYLLFVWWAARKRRTT